MGAKDKTISDFLKDILKLIKSHKDYVDIYENYLNSHTAERNMTVHFFSDSCSYSSGEKLKNSIIGGLPKLLLSKKYFPTNLDIDKFAKKYLDMDIPNPAKKSREELIGRVISKIAGLKRNELESFNNVLNTVLNKADSGKLGNFFLEWDKAIRNITHK